VKFRTSELPTHIVQCMAALVT